MRNYFTTATFWRWWRQPNPLAKHLPRLLLDRRYHPRFVRRCAVTQRMCQQLQLLDWNALPVSVSNKRTGWQTIPIAAYVGAYLVRLDHNLTTFGRLRSFLRDSTHTSGSHAAAHMETKPIADFFPHCTVMFADIAG